MSWTRALFPGASVCVLVSSCSPPVRRVIMRLLCPRKCPKVSLVVLILVSFVHCQEVTRNRTAEEVVVDDLDLEDEAYADGVIISDHPTTNLDIWNASNATTRSSSLATTEPSSTMPSISDSSTSTEPANYDNSDTNYDDSNTSSDDSDSSDDDPPNLHRSTSMPYELEGESLSKLQKFLLSSVEALLKEALPVILRSGQETNVSAQCASSFFALMNGLRDNKIWAYRMLDASGKPPSGILEGTLTDFGSFEECLGVTSKASSSSSFSGPFDGRYCLLDLSADFERDPPLGLSKPPPGIHPQDIVWDPALQIFWSMNRVLSFRYGACIPSTCSRGDLDQLANYFATPAGMKVNIHSCQLDKPYVPDTVQVVIASFFAFMVAMVLIGTIVEYVQLVKNGDEGKKEKAPITEKSLVNFFKAFSLHTNTKRLLAATKNTSGSPLRCLDGMRFITLAWIILGHTYFFTDIVHYQHYRRVKQVRDVDDHFLSMPLANFTLSVDTFFFISGLLLIFSNWKKLQLSNGKLDVIEFFVHRVWRIWPAYAATIGLALILPMIGDGPLWPAAVESAAATCRKSWWTNLAFVNNFLDSDQVCLFHTWFLSASMQFHVMGGFILYVIYKSPSLGILMAIVLTALSSLASFAFAYVKNVRVPSVIAFEVFADYDQKILKIYTAPYNHFGSYLAGIIVGYFLVKYKNAPIPKSLQSTAWMVSMAVCAAVIAGPHEAFKSNLPNIVNSSLYYAFARTAWSWAIGWIVFACATGRGGPVSAFLSWSAFGPLSNLSYLAYLTHPLLMILHTGRVRERIYFGHYEMVSIFLSRLVMTMFLAYVVHVVIEVPFASIETYIFPKKKSRIDKAPKPTPRDTSKTTSVSAFITRHGHHSQHYVVSQENNNLKGRPMTPRFMSQESA